MGSPTGLLAEGEKGIWRYSFENNACRMRKSLHLCCPFKPRGKAPAIPLWCPFSTRSSTSQTSTAAASPKARCPPPPHLILGDRTSCAGISLSPEDCSEDEGLAARRTLVLMEMFRMRLYRCHHPGCDILLYICRMVLVGKLMGTEDLCIILKRKKSSPLSSRSSNWTKNYIYMRPINRRKEPEVLLRAHGSPIMKLGAKEMTKGGSLYTF